MTDLMKDLAEAKQNWDREDGYSAELLRTHHATIQKNAEDLEEWEEFGRQIEKRLRYNDLSLTGGYPEMIDVLIEKAKRLRALERAIENRMQRAKDADHLQEQVTLRGILAYADEILREGELHDQD